MAITTRQQFVLTVPAVAPDRSDRVDHPFGRELVAQGDFRLAGWTAAERAAFFEQPRPGRAMNRAIHAAATQQSRVRRIYNRVHALFGDVAFDDFDSIHGLFRFHTRTFVTGESFSGQSVFLKP